MNNITIEELRRRKYKVRVTHERYFCRQTDLGFETGKARMDEIRANKLADYVVPVGGNTKIVITDQKGTNFVGEAKCSFKENYNRKRGISIALGRAVKEFMP